MGEISDEVGGTIRTGPFGSQLHEADYEDTGIPVVMPKDISSGYVSADSIARIGLPTAERMAAHAMSPGDIVYGRRGDIGRRAIIREQEAGWICGTGCLRISIGDEVLDPKFLYYYLGAPDVVAKIAGQAIGATMPNLNTSILRSVEVTYPPLNTQRRIADTLSAYDDLIENNTRRIAILEEISRSLYREWFVNFRFPGHEDVEIAEGGRIPPTWKRVSLFDLAEVTYGFPFKSKLFTEDDIGTAVVRIRDVKAGSTRTRTSESAPDKYLLENGDLLIGMDGDFHIGTWVGGKAFLNQRVVRFRPKSGFTAALLKLSLKAPIEALQNAIVGTTVAHLGDKDLRTIELTVPDRETLIRASSLLDPMFDLGVNLRLQNAVLRNTRDLLLPRLISGELSVEVAEAELAATGS